MQWKKSKLSDGEYSNPRSDREANKSEVWSSIDREEKDESEVSLSATSREIPKNNLGSELTVFAKNPQLLFKAEERMWDDANKKYEGGQTTSGSSNRVSLGFYSKELLGPNINQTNMIAVNQSLIGSSNNHRASNITTEEFLVKSNAANHVSGSYFSNFSEIENKYSMPQPLDSMHEKENNRESLPPQQSVSSMVGNNNNNKILFEDFSLSNRIANYIKV